MDALTAPAIDQHCHSLWRDYRAVDVARFRQGFSESSAILADHMSTSLGDRRELALLAKLYNCASDEAAMLRARASFHPADLLHRANVVTLLVDCGVETDTTLSLLQLQEVTGIPCHEILRIETIAQDILATADNFDQFRAGDPPSSAGHSWRRVELANSCFERLVSMELRVLAQDCLAQDANERLGITAFDHAVGQHRRRRDLLLAVKDVEELMGKPGSLGRDARALVRRTRGRNVQEAVQIHACGGVIHPGASNARGERSSAWAIAYAAVHVLWTPSRSANSLLV